MKILFISIMFLLSLVGSCFAQPVLYEYLIEDNDIGIFNDNLPDYDALYFAYNGNLNYISEGNVYFFDENGTWILSFSVPLDYRLIASSDILLAFIKGDGQLSAYQSGVFIDIDILIDKEIKSGLFYNGLNLIGEDNNLYLADIDFFKPLDLSIPLNIKFLFNYGSNFYAIDDSNRFYTLVNSKWEYLFVLTENIEVENIFHFNSRIIIQGLGK